MSPGGRREARAGGAELWQEGWRASAGSGAQSCSQAESSSGEVLSVCPLAACEFGILRLLLQHLIQVARRALPVQ